jgi:glutamyl-tRNA synthetase
MLLRVEDLDGPRVKPQATAAATADLKWLGLRWEKPVMYQSQRELIYQSALEQLIAQGQAYPCVCSRKDIEMAAGAPHTDDPVRVYPGTCRSRWASAREARDKTSRPVAWRVRVEDAEIEFEDVFAGIRRFNLAETCGDFVVFRGQGLAAYQLAVVVDDAAAGVDRIVRGHDLLESAARQIHLRRLLGLRPEPKYWHLPLVIGPDGRRLAKRHGDTRIAHYRELGCTRERMLGLLGYWSGLLENRMESDLDDLQQRFDPARIPREEMFFTADDDAFLRGE